MQRKPIFAVTEKGKKPMTEKEIKEFVRDRDAAVMTFDVEEFKRFYQKWRDKGLYTIGLPQNNKVLEITMRKMAVHSTGIPEEVREEAGKWLTDRGFSLDLF